MTELERRVLGIVNAHPDGLRHPAIVLKVLEGGYVHEGENLSRDVFDVLKRLAFLDVRENGTRVHKPKPPNLPE